MRQTSAIGELLVEELQDELSRRTVRVARLRSLGRTVNPDMLPPLYDPQLLWMAPQGFTLGGTERLTTRGKMTEYGQTWLVRLKENTT